MKPYLLLIISLLIYLIFLSMCKNKTIFLKTFLPYMTGLLALDLLTISRAFEYRALCFLGFIPMLMPWMIKYKNNAFYVILFILAFALFTITAFHGYGLFSTIDIKEQYFTAFYLAYFIGITTLTICFISKQIIDEKLMFKK